MATTNNKRAIPYRIYKQLAEQLENEARFNEEEYFKTEIEIENYWFDCEVEVDCDYDDEFTYYDIANLEVSCMYVRNEDDYEEYECEFDHKKFCEALDNKAVEEYYESAMAKMMNNYNPVAEFDSIISDTFRRNATISL